jgi:hypothetical protein
VRGVGSGGVYAATGELLALLNASSEDGWDYNNRGCKSANNLFLVHHQRAAVCGV